MQNRTHVIAVALALVVGFSGCATKMRVYSVSNPTERKGGIPFYAPKPVLRVNDPIEVKRAETLYALIRLGGMQLFLFKIDISNYADSVNRLRQLLNIGAAAPIQLVPAPEDLSFLTKAHTSTDDSSKRTKAENDIDEKTKKVEKNEERAAITPQSPATETDAYQTKDASKAYEVFFVPDYTKEFELIINPSKLASSKISVTLSNGMLTALNVETGENKVVESLTDAIKTVLTTAADIKKAEIGKAQALELERLKSSASPPPTTQQSLGETKQIDVKIVGYVKEVKVSVLKPGLYDISRVLTANEFVLPTEEAAYWRRVIF
jgi:hypothetical protein